MKLLKPLLPILWAVKQGCGHLANLCAKVEFNKLMPMIDKIDSGYADRRWAAAWKKNHRKHLLEWHVVDFKDNFVLACNLTLKQAERVQDENYAGLMIVQDDALTPEMLVEVKKDREEIK